jgi:CHASE3 domain sensor protein
LNLRGYSEEEGMKKIGTKLLLSFMAVIVLMIGFSTLLYFSMNKLADSIAKFNRYGEEQTVAGDLRLNLMWLTMPANDYIITADKEEYLKEFTAQLSVLENDFKNIEPFELSGTEKAIVKELHESFDAIKKVGLSIFEIKNPVGTRKAAEMKEMDYKYAEPAERRSRILRLDKQQEGSASKAADEAVRMMKLR